MIKNTKNRSGITLLFVISMIVLFLLMGSSFVIMTSQFRRSSDDNARVATRRDDARTLVSRAFYDLFRGPSLDDVFSPLRGHSILGDQYGYGMRAQVNGISVVPGTNAQLYSIDLGTQFQDILSNIVSDFSTQGGTYDGQILTFTSGPAEGISTRIVNYQVTLSGNSVTGRSFIVMPQWDDSEGFDPSNFAQITNSSVLINGRPFAGSGAGRFNAGVPINQPALSIDAYEINQVGTPRQLMLLRYLGLASSGVGNPASVNEDYDAPDYQNVFLAGIGDVNNDGTIDENEILMSFDRPQLRAHGVGDSTKQTFQVPGTDEVDNDGDGVNDGIWIDIGLPIQTDTRGRVYKPLVSYLVVDMDGKVNVNAHGQLADLDPNRFVPTRSSLLNGENPRNFGSGFGPPEISLHVSGGSPTVFGSVESAAIITSRYGADGLPGQAGGDPISVNKWFSHPTDRFIFNPTTSTGGLYGSPLDSMGRFATGVPDYSLSLPVNPFDSTSASVSVPAGLPIVDAPVATSWPTVGGNELFDNPFEMNFRDEEFDSTNGNNDQPFTAREMERVLRRFDSDTVMLPPRLRELTRTTVDNTPSARFAFTHASWEVPVPPSNVVTDLRNRLLMEAGLEDDPDTFPPGFEAFLNSSVYQMLSPDLIAGLKMDPNRPFGGGRDGDGDQVVDETWHSMGNAGIDSQTNEPEDFPQLTGTGNQQIPFDHNGFNINPSNGDSGLTPQQVFARHLYILTLLMTERDIDNNGVFNANDWHEYDDNNAVDINDIYAYRTDIAQWAINVANFRDRDSIMHPFEFDLEPFDGWDVNQILGDSNTNLSAAENPMLTRVVWGLERPEMLISEAMCNHDRATEDRDDDDGARPRAEKLTRLHPTNPGEDPTLDSRYVPRASVFLEFYNPWISHSNASINNANHAYPPELYDANLRGIELDKRAPDDSPVWQIVVTRVARDQYLENSDNPSDPMFEPRYGALAEDQVLRRVYFTQPPAAGAEFTGNRVYYPDPAINIPELPPGEHAVVGSSGIVNGNQYHTYFGRRRDGTPTNSTNTRRITLDVGNQAVEQVVYDEGASRLRTFSTSAVVVPIGMNVVDGPRSLATTDPVAGYVGIGGGINTDADGFQLFNTVVDEPADTNNTDAVWTQLQFDGINIVIRRAIHLRRLANPLAPHDAVLNPYLTIDSMSVPINVFNGQTTVNETGGQQSGGDRAFISRERGANSTGDGKERLLWQTDQGITGAAARGLYANTDFNGADNHYHSYNFANSLGELDVAYRLNPTDAGFPALAWNNRPFISHLEMMNVPFTSSYRLLHQYDFANETGDYNDFRTAGDDVSPEPGGGGRFPYLLQFHADSTSDRVDANRNRAMSLPRLMDYLEVPSRFIGTETFLNPQIFNSTGSASGLGLNAPFNKVSNYRYPGKINLNTIFDERVWNGLMRNTGRPGNYGFHLDYNRFNTSRLGVDLRPASGGPSNFLAPFRSARSGNLVAESAYVVRSAEPGLFRRPNTSEAELLRPLLDIIPEDLTSTSTPPERSPQFRYASLQRLGNLVTTRSSVFAIWITIGFFEVDQENSMDLSSPMPGDIVFGEEVGSDTGEVERYRGFYMVDRSIPVGFEPGEDHNVDQAILTSSIIQRSETN